MIQEFKERCTYCGGEIIYKPGDSLLKCPRCGNTLEVVKFEREWNRLMAAAERGSQDRKELADTKAENTVLRQQLEQTVRSLGSMELTQESARGIYSRMQEQFEGNVQVQSAIQRLTDVMLEKSQEGKDVLTDFTKAVLADQEEAEKSLKYLQQTANQLVTAAGDLSATSRVSGEMFGRIFTMQMDMQKKNQLMTDLMSWLQNVSGEDYARLERLADAASGMEDQLDRISRKADELLETADMAQESLDEFRDQYMRDRLEELHRQYDLARKAQASKEFDLAARYYRGVLAKGGDEAEIYWRLVLCHYCVDYQKDENGRYIPTVLNPDLTDPEQMSVRKDLKRVTSEEGVASYSAKLAEIDRILDEYRMVRWKNQCDVFISVKQGTEGNFTADSDTAARLYDFLTEKGLKVFNSRKTPPPAGKNYEPYIISALMSAKVMIVVGSSADNLEARWVKNEWARYQWLQRHEKEKTGRTDRLLFCYLSGGMQPAQIPRALDPGRQAVLDGPGAFMEILKALQPLLEQKQKEEQKNSIRPVLNQMGIWLMMHRYEKVTQKYQELVDSRQFLDNAVLHMYALCALNQVDDIHRLAESESDFENQVPFRFALKTCTGKEARKELKLLQWKHQDWLLLQRAELSPYERMISSSEEWYEEGKRKRKNGDYEGAAFCFLQAAEQGHAMAQSRLGFCYESGRGREKDMEHAAFWYKAAAEQGLARGQYQLGWCYEFGAGVEKSDEQAVYWFRKAAEQGQADALNYMGIHYAKGTGIEKNLREAVNMYRKAADRGSEDAMANLGSYYEKGVVVEKDERNAIFWYQKAADGGLARAQRILGNCYSKGIGVEQNDEQAVYWYQKAADQGDEIAQNSLGLCYEKGHGVAGNDEMAVYWYRKAAEQGYTYAQFNLAYDYSKGTGVEQNEEKASYWFEKAAQQGHRAAQNLIGLRYEKGKGIEKDEKKAFFWYQKSAEQGYARAQCNLGCCYEDGIGAAKNPGLAFLWYRKSAEQGLRRGENNMGRCFEFGIGTEKDFVQAAIWYRKAADKGSPGSQYYLARLYENGQGVEKDLNQAVYWYRKAAEQGDEDAKEALQKYTDSPISGEPSGDA